ncbi:hypothetical protein Syun_024510 [Stephania yunnanensis]|uniref:Bifunctional inhibitor/plant lipid transfer protein/seed storage helical domain-containing protein n=1 Tax=Stephania yunnanensis TaxID=152371 RepID=A0AAP0I4I9_9MAGN
MKKFVVVVYVAVVVVVLVGRVSYCAEPTVAEQCNNEFTKLGVCLDYATGKSDSPSPLCCSTVKQIREANEVCLCYVIQMTHKGEASLKQMGLQEEKLFQLSSACKLTNTSIADCPSKAPEYTSNFTGRCHLHKDELIVIILSSLTIVTYGVIQRPRFILVTSLVLCQTLVRSVYNMWTVQIEETRLAYQTRCLMPQGQHATYQNGATWRQENERRGEVGQWCH